ncbi:MAG: DUF3168 domain-containing protein [Roseitalea sp.]|jgi:hypothetical protein|uniref:DUF3168 domain-containing protein n=1 Tax=Effrenium voratum TaxID=2562239 RepID=A0AA36IQ49_9DINO|nr:DUF3168 domain-containing protein [Oceaniradius stylonematis]MBO6554599.1 DUF3168 domain-containing protein [Roseitalea sp.]MBO6953642.1 DUF3168 domain-containing protein [Rhizobiaceae bacterium]CAJ1391635.1 unnamed protein product [Effrenium voratum]MBO6593929.1 DUF3168 domain-containing protein [Roseitalea sp.]MBO6601386.1 DUF3168 domain-containing protein [Roseitalea sp.]
MTGDLHAWLLDRLSNDAALVADLGDPPRVFDRPPPRRALPSVYVGRIEVADWSTDDARGQAVSVVIHAYARGPGRTDIDRIVAGIESTLTDAVPATAQSTRIVLATPVAISTAYERGQAAFHATLRLRFLCAAAGA